MPNIQCPSCGREIAPGAACDGCGHTAVNLDWNGIALRTMLGEDVPPVGYQTVLRLEAHANDFVPADLFLPGLPVRRRNLQPDAIIAQAHLVPVEQLHRRHLSSPNLVD